MRGVREKGESLFKDVWDIKYISVLKKARGQHLHLAITKTIDTGVESVLLLISRVKHSLKF